MSFNLEVLKVTKPEEAKALIDWRENYENRVINLHPLEETDFDIALTKLRTHLRNTAKSVVMRTVVGPDGLQSVYFEVEPRKIN